MVLGLLLSGNAYAEIKNLPKGTTVNQLINQGYKFIGTDSAAYTSKKKGSYVETFYHLMKNNELVTCSVKNPRYDKEVSCWKP